MSIFDRLPEDKREEVISMLASSLWYRMKPLIDERLRRKALERAGKDKENL